MRRYFFAILMALSLCGAQDFTLEDIAGIWEIPEEIDGQVSIGEIFIQNNKAFVYAFEYANKVDDRLILRDTSNESSDAMKLRNTIFLANLECEDGEFINGKIYRPSNGGVYYVSARLSEDKSVLYVRASFDRFGFLGMTLTWNRIENGAYEPISRENIKTISALMP